MNKQIKNLMDQTLDEKFAGTWSTMDMQDLTKFSERFAELIVKECANKVDWILAEDGKTQGDLIREHFGVTE